MIIDTHSHLNFEDYRRDLDEVIKRTLDNGIFAINVGSDYETSRKAIEIAGNYKGMYAAVGFHPIYADSKSFDKKEYKELAKKAVAIGEIGLDYYRNMDLFKQKQKEVFIKQLELAKELDLPVILHSRMAHDDLIEILRGYKLKGVIHCFTGGINELKQYLDLGYYIGLNGIIFKMNLEKVIKNCPLEKILVETDCPYLTPPQEGEKRNEPLFVKYVIEKIAEIKGISFNEVSDKTTENAKGLFNLF